MYPYVFHVSVCIACICMYIPVLYVISSSSFLQNGLMPLAVKEYKDFPLTRANGDAPCPRVESFVVAITFLRLPSPSCVVSTRPYTSPMTTSS